MDLDSESLLRALRISEVGSFKRASVELRIAQPALSRSVKLLEGQLGTTIFERSVKGVTLTSAGEAIMAHARVIRHELQSAIEHIQAEKFGARRTIAFGAVPVHTLETFVAELLQTYEEFKDVRLKVEVADKNHLLESLLEGSIEFVFGPVLGTAVPSGVVEEILYYEDWCIACGKENELFTRRKINLRDLTSQRWVLGPAGTQSRERMEEFCVLHSIDTPEVVIEVENLPARREIVAQSDLLSLVQRGQVTQWSARDRLRVLPFDWRQLNRPIGTQRLKEMVPSRFLILFSQHIKKSQYLPVKR